VLLLKVGEGRGRKEERREEERGKGQGDTSKYSGGSCLHYRAFV